MKISRSSKFLSVFGTSGTNVTWIRNVKELSYLEYFKILYMWTLENISPLLNKEVYIYSYIYIYIYTHIKKQYGLTEVSGQPAEDPTIQMCYNSNSNFIPHLADIHDNHLQMDKNLSEKDFWTFCH